MRECETMKRMVQVLMMTAFLTAGICIFLETASAMIPGYLLEESSRETSAYYYNRELFPVMERGNEATRTDYYADTLLLNVIYGIDCRRPFYSIICALYYDAEGVGTNQDYAFAVWDERKPNTSYFRYWHGSIVWLRPLLIRLNGTDILRLYKIILYLGMGAAFLFFISRGGWKISISLLLSCVWIRGQMLAACLAHGNIAVFTVCLIPFFLHFSGKSRIRLWQMCVISGIVTCFIDFLTIETVALSLPLGVLLLYRRQDEQKKKNGNLFTTFYAVLIWGISYAAMFLLKWLLAAALMGGGCIADSFRRTGAHIQGNAVLSVCRNIQMLFTGADVPQTAVGIMAGIYVGLLCLAVTAAWRTGRKELILLMMIPYLRYVLLAEHSAQHEFFTYRAQMTTICIMIYMFLEWIEKRTKEKLGESV